MTFMQSANSANSYGIDVSHLNGAINWSQVAASTKRVKFAFIKASEGVTLKDANFGTNAASARQNNIPIGAYHFLRAGTTVGFLSRNYNSTRAWDEADNFMTAVSSGLGGGGDWGDLHLVIDFETPTSPSAVKSGLPSSHETLRLLGYAYQFRLRVEAKTGRRCMLYAAPDIMTTWNSYEYSHQSNTLLDMPLWAASFLSAHAGNPPVQAGGWQQWLVWQFSATGTVSGIAGSVDQNYGPTNVNWIKDLPTIARGLIPIKNLYVLNPNQRLQVVLTNDGKDGCPFYNAIHKEQINQENTLTFSIPADHPDAIYVTAGNLVFYRDFDDPVAVQLFEILRVEESHLGSIFKDVTCQHKVFELIDAWIENLTLSNVSAMVALNTILNVNSDVEGIWYPGAVSPTTKTHTFNFHRINVMDAIRQVALAFGTEWQFRIQYWGPNIRAKYIDFLKRGSKVPFGSTYNDYEGRTFTYGRDLTSIKRTVDTSRIVTKAFGIGATTQITFSTVSWTTAGGLNPATKPAHVLVSCGYGQSVEDVAATCTWGRYVSTAHTPKALARVAEYTSNTTNKQNLLQETWDFIQANKNPWVAYELTPVDLEFITGSADQKIRLGNTVRVVDTLFEPVLRTSARVYEVDRNLSQPEKSQFVISNILPVIGAS